MGNVPKSRRRSHEFEAPKKLHALRIFVTELSIKNFGYNKERYEKFVQSYERRFADKPDLEDIVRRKRERNISYYQEFVDEETIVTRDFVRKIVSEFEFANSIYPGVNSTEEELNERKLHFDYAIGYLFGLKQEIQYIAEILPCNKNKYSHLGMEIDAAIKLVRGVKNSTGKRYRKALEQSKAGNHII